MCAIAGILDFAVDKPSHLPVVSEYIDRLRHRGPDDGGFFQDDFCTLGAARLAQIDAVGGAQPMTSPDGRWTLVFNGEIHNHRALRSELSCSWNFRTRSDTEVLLAAISVWHAAALPRLNGIFAFFAWDAVTRRGIAARDRLGVKPLAWRQLSGGAFAFASEAKALLAPTPVVNEMAVLEHLVAPCFSGVRQSMFQEVHYLQPGCLLTIDASHTQERSWWRYDLHRAADQDFQALAAELREHLPTAVERSLDVDAPAAVMLSGGLDSTLLAALASRHGVARAYTIVFEGQDGFDYDKSLMVKSDDLPCAIEAAREIGLDHRVVRVSRAGWARDLQQLAATNDALPTWEQELAQHHLARAISADGYRAVIAGDAADETHFGYGFMLDKRATGNVRELLAHFGHVPLRAEMCERVPAIHDELEAETLAAGYDARTRAGHLQRVTHLLTRLWLPRLLHNGDIHFMAHGVEPRVPFADAELLEVAVRVHPLQALRHGLEKSVLREAAKGMMPEKARLRRKSSLPKDDGSAAIMKLECAKSLDAAPAFIGHWLDLKQMRRLCDPARVLTEMERGLLFRVIGMHHWSVAYNVQLP